MKDIRSTTRIILTDMIMETITDIHIHTIIIRTMIIRGSTHIIIPMMRLTGMSMTTLSRRLLTLTSTFFLAIT